MTTDSGSAADDPVADIVRGYRAFARREARGRSAADEALAESVAGNAGVVDFVASLPPGKRQPQLLFAAARYLLGSPPEIGQLHDLISRSSADLAQVMLARRTQTNEPARCAMLLPVLAQLPQPLALLDAGASAGLTLLIDGLQAARNPNPERRLPGRRYPTAGSTAPGHRAASPHPVRGRQLRTAIARRWALI